MQNHEKNTYSLCHIVIAVLAVVLMGLIVWMMVIVSHMQGTARVVNYAGLVRGTTQRMVKLEYLPGYKDTDLMYGCPTVSVLMIKPVR